MTRSEIFANSIAELRNYIGKGLPQLATCEFTDAVHAAMMTPGCESQRVRLVDLPRLAERVAEMADAHERVVGERDELAATLANERGEGEPPHLSFKWDVDAGYEGAWRSTVIRDAEGWPVSVRRCLPTRWTFDGGRTSHPSARAAMRAAAGVKS